MSEHLQIQKKFLLFAEILKDADVPISSAELLDLFRALPLVDLTEKIELKQTLAATLIKDQSDMPAFEACFAVFFEGMADAFITGAGNRAHPVDAIDLALLLRSESSGESLGGASIFPGSGNAMGEGERSREPAPDPALREAVNRQKNRDREIGKTIHDREERLLRKNIYQLSPSEVREMRELLNRFAHKLKNRISLRKRRLRHGGIDIKRTIRENLRYGGLPFTLCRHDQKIDRPQLVVLCDISGSVSQYSRFMLLLTHTLQSLFSKVRTFAFVSKTVEITGLFREMDPETALNSIFGDTEFTYGWGSNYGKCLNELVTEYGDSLTGKTTVFILGDARNNYQDPGIASFIRMGERVRQVYWLNPDRAHLWGWGDSIAPLYQPHCTAMKEVNNVMDLAVFIEGIFD